MKGKVKWFSESKGYGYIVADNDCEHYFNIIDIKGVDLPKNGDIVEFNSTQSQKGFRANGINIVERKKDIPNQPPPLPNQSNNDPRILCTGCNRKMVPRFVYERKNLGGGNYLSHSVCPYCGTFYKKLGTDDCFIATAIYEDRYAEEVIALRRFRDESLSIMPFGIFVIKFYYIVSPHIAKQLKTMPYLSLKVKNFLDWLSRKYM